MFWFFYSTNERHVSRAISSFSLLAIATALAAAQNEVPQAPSRALAPIPAVEQASPLDAFSEDSVIDTLDLAPEAPQSQQDNSVTEVERMRRPRTIQDVKFHSVSPADQSDAVGTLKAPTMYSTKSWVAPRAVHRSLFFHDNALEREGRTRSAHLQPAISATKFYVDAALFPFRRLTPSGHRLHYAVSTK